MDHPGDLLPFDNEDSFRELMQRVREGSEDAAWELVHCFGEHIRRAVRRVLDRKLRSKFDSMDFVQLVLLSFFRMHEQADRFQRPQHLVAFLAGMAANKVQTEARRRLTAEKHDVRCEVPLEHSCGKARKEMIGREPEPVEAAIARERWDQLLEGQPAHYRRIIQLKLQGQSFADIGTTLGLDTETVRRFLKKLLETTAL